jgi:hypothetical protein
MLTIVVVKVCFTGLDGSDMLYSQWANGGLSAKKAIVNGKLVLGIFNWKVCSIALGTKDMHFQLVHYTVVLFISAQHLGVLEVNWNSPCLVTGRCAKGRHPGLQQNQYTIGETWLHYFVQARPTGARACWAFAL